MVSGGQGSPPRQCGSPQCQPGQRWSPSGKRLNWELQCPNPASQWDLEKERKKCHLTANYLGKIKSTRIRTHKQTCEIVTAFKFHTLANIEQTFFRHFMTGKGVKEILNKSQFPYHHPQNKINCKDLVKFMSHLNNNLQVFLCIASLFKVSLTMPHVFI